MEIADLITYLLTPAAQIAVIIGLAELVKKVGLPSKYIPIFDVLAGLLFGIGIFGVAMGYGVVNGALIGVFEGLSACGLFSGVKNVFDLGQD